MLTLFTTAKPFIGHSGIIQRNALKSWTLMHPDVEIILFGDDEGAAEAARELGIRHEPRVARNEHGTKRLDYLFTRAQAIARHDLLCYVNCDIVLLPDFCSALKRVRAAHTTFLAVGRRWDVDISEPCDFSVPDWPIKVREKALQSGKQRTREWIDYFAFTRGLYGPDMPQFVIGRVHWDHWLLWRAWQSKNALVDVSPVVVAVHQNHDYGYHPQGVQGVWHSEESKRNFELAGGWNHLRTIADAREILSADTLKPNWRRHWNAMKRYAWHTGQVLFAYAVRKPWFLLLRISRPLRHALGLHADGLRRSREKV